VRRAPLLAAAVAAALAAPLLVLFAAARNRSGEPEAEVVLTEREARLVPLGEGRRWALLRLDWNKYQQLDRREASWFGREKLAELGFDTRLPADHPKASAFYGWQTAREAFLALELDGAAALAADAESPDDRVSRSRLHAVDAARDAATLRARHPDRHRVLVVRGVVSAECAGRWDPATRKVSAPFVRGVVKRLLVEEIQLPRERRALLDALARGEARPAGAGATTARATAAGTPSTPEPRYVVVLRTGRRLEPWVAEVRAFP
jgi:hypothetical protein